MPLVSPPQIHDQEVKHYVSRNARKGGHRISPASSKWWRSVLDVLAFDRECARRRNHHNQLQSDEILVMS
jgi:hypothetical protein